MTNEISNHYDRLIKDGNDPVKDSQPMKEYMNKWDGDAFIRSLAIDASKDVLEIGVGTGRIAVKIASQCNSFTGIDLSEETIRTARTHLRESNLIVGDFLKYEFKMKFDVIYSSLTFLHIENKKAAIEKIKTLMKEDSVVVISFTKDKSTTIDYGTSSIDVFPIEISKVEDIIQQEGLCTYESYELDHSNVVVFGKKN